MAKWTKRTPEARERLLEAVADGLSLSAAAKHCGACRKTVYNWRREDEEFRRDFEIAYQLGTDVYEDEARRRALTGSDNLLALILRERDPARWARLTAEPRADTNAPADNVHFYLPDNGRHLPEQLSSEEFSPEEKALALKAAQDQAPQRPMPSAPVAELPPNSSWRKLG